jgi:hypothetical protein
MTGLLDETVSAHGGMARWNELTNINTHLGSTGAVWEVKGQTGLFTSVDVDIDPHHQHVAATPFVKPGWHGVFERDRVWIENETGALEEERAQPRSAFDGHELFTQWDHLHAIYFGGTALWTYITLPFVMTQPGFTTEEIEPWTENGETWRRLQVTFPQAIATHTAQQVLYIDDGGLIRRHDYTAEVTAGGPGAHYLHGHKDFDGIVFPTNRQVFPRQDDNRAASEPLLINMEFDNYTLT